MSDTSSSSNGVSDHGARLLQLRPLSPNGPESRLYDMDANQYTSACAWLPLPSPSLSLLPAHSSSTTRSSVCECKVRSHYTMISRVLVSIGGQSGQTRRACGSSCAYNACWMRALSHPDIHDTESASLWQPLPSLPLVTNHDHAAPPSSLSVAPPPPPSAAASWTIVDVIGTVASH